MTRTERLFRQGLLPIQLFGSYEDIPMIEDFSDLRYIATDFSAFCEGFYTSVNIYEDIHGNLKGVINR